MFGDSYAHLISILVNLPRAFPELRRTPIASSLQCSSRVHHEAPGPGWNLRHQWTPTDQWPCNRNRLIGGTYHIFFGLFVRRNFREYHHNSYGQTYGTNVPPFRILKFPLMKWNHVFPIAATEIRRFHHKRFAIYSHLTHIQHPTENMVE